MICTARIQLVAIGCKGTKKCGKKLFLILDKASYHDSQKVRDYVRDKNIILRFYPTGHLYLNPVEQSWNDIKWFVDASVRFADKEAHLDAVYDFIKQYEFDCDLEKYLNQKPPKGIMRPVIGLNEKSIRK